MSFEIGYSFGRTELKLCEFSSECQWSDLKLLKKQLYSGTERHRMTDGRNDCFAQWDLHATRQLHTRGKEKEAISGLVLEIYLTFTHRPVSCTLHSGQNSFQRLIDAHVCTDQEKMT